ECVDHGCDHECDKTCGETKQTFPMRQTAQVPEHYGIQRQGCHESRAVGSEEQCGTEMKQSVEENLSEAKGKEQKCGIAIWEQCQGRSKCNCVSHADCMNLSPT